MLDLVADCLQLVLNHNDFEAIFYSRRLMSVLSDLPFIREGVDIVILRNLQ